MSDVRRVGIDETSRRKRHKYVTLFVDLDQSRVLYATKGKGASPISSKEKGRPVGDLESPHPSAMSTGESTFLVAEEFAFDRGSQIEPLRSVAQFIFINGRTHSRLEPIKEAAYTIKRHWDGVLAQAQSVNWKASTALFRRAKARTSSKFYNHHRRETGI